MTEIPPNVPTRSGGVDMAQIRGENRRRWTGAVATLVLVLGVGASVAGGLAWRTHQRDQAKSEFDMSSSTIAEAITVSLQRDADLSATARVMVETTTTLTNSQFSQWFQLLAARDRFPGSFGLMYIQKVAQSDLGTFEQTVAGDPPFGVAPSGAFSIVPSGATGPYCLTRTGSVQLSKDSVIPSTALLPLISLAASDLDYCALPIDSLLEASAASGTPAATTLAALVESTPTLPGEAPMSPTLSKMFARAGLIATLTPVYANGVPASVGARDASLRGWVLGVDQASSILAPVLHDHPGFSAVLSYVNPHQPRVVLDRTGPTTGDLSRTFRLTGPGPWSVTLAAPTPNSGISATGQGLIVFLGGLLVSVLLYLLIRVLIRARASALALVDERTAQLQHQAMHDSLTDLPNRELIFDRVSQMLARARRDLTEIAVLFVDLDQFKDVNDTYGHGAGDELLRKVASRFGSLVREADTVGRLGGDEFVILLEDAIGESRPEELADRLLLSLLEPIAIGGGIDAVVIQSASIGIAKGMRDSAEDLITDADIALYEAKATAPGRYIVFDQQMRAAVRTRLELEVELRTALAKRQFFLVYQPIFDLRHEGIVGAEALLRWRHPERGVVMPAEFIPTLESTGMILDVGRFVLVEACAQAAQWHQDGSSLYVSVNVSARQLERADFVDTVHHALSTAGLPPALLTLEITETTLMRYSELSVRRLAELKDVGVKLAIDDFGTGYCSLAYLQQFPVDAIKIDQSFVASMEASPEGARLVHTIVQLGRDLHLETVAEGIETRSQLERLQSEDCVSGQGYLLGRPLAVETMTELLVRQRAQSGMAGKHLERA